MFLQYHYLTPYHATLLNRDDTGLAKRITFGGVPRLRVSSQCQKRHWRDWLVRQTDLPSAVRSRHLFSRTLLGELVDAGVEEDKARDLVRTFASELLQEGKKAAVDPATLELRQPLLFGYPELRFFTRLLLDAAKIENKKEAAKFLKERIAGGRANWRALVQQAGGDNAFAGIEGALFGRFVTSDIMARLDAPVHVAHAFTTHELDTELDFFTVVDDLALDEETGAAHANETELGAGVFYGYVVVDVSLLVSNLTGVERSTWRDADHRGARTLLRTLLEGIATVTPGAKLGATAPYSRAELVLVEVGEGQPRSLANAFLSPVRGRPDRSLIQASVDAMAGYLQRLDEMYGRDDTRRWLATIHDWPASAPSPASLPGVLDEAVESIFGGA